MAVIREIALDKTESEEHRSNAIVAYARVLLGKKRHEDALKLCQEILRTADKPGVLDAALRAGCFVERDRCGHLRAELDFLASWPDGPAGQAVSALSQPLHRTVATLAALAGRAMVPLPAVLRFPTWAANPRAQHAMVPELRPPAWYRFPPGELPPALRITRPRMEPPDWSRRVSLPLLKR